MNIEYDNIHEVYLGYYIPKSNVRYLLGVSKKKMVIKNYLENHRGLDEIEYSIEKEELSDSELLIKYSDYIISEYYGYYIPEIDQTLIELYSPNIQDLLNITINNLKEIYLLSNNIKKIDYSDNLRIMYSIKSLMKFKSKSIINKLERKSYKTSPILFCNIEEYMRYIRTFQEEREMNNRYKDIIMS